MTEKKSDTNGKEWSLVSDWKRPAGPINAWKVIEGEKKLNEGTIRRVRFSIQDVPEDRHEETVSHMCRYFVADEVTCKSLNLINDSDALNDFRKLWRYFLKQGVSVAAYTIDSNDKLLELAGVNITFVATKEIDKVLEDFTIGFKSANVKKLFLYIHEVSKNVDVCKIYGVDKYITALGLSVAPAFRGQKLGVRLLEARNDIGRKYGITATSTIFTGPSSQIQAERAGFETAFFQEYNEVEDKAGKLLFPNIEAKTLKIMIKSLE